MGGTGQGKILEQLGFFSRAPNPPLWNLSRKPTAPRAKQSLHLHFSFHLTNKIHRRGSLDSHLKLRLNVSLLPLLCEFFFHIQYKCVKLKALFLLDILKVSRSKLGKYSGHMLLFPARYSDSAMGCYLHP